MIHGMMVVNDKFGRDIGWRWFGQFYGDILQSPWTAWEKLWKTPFRAVGLCKGCEPSNSYMWI